MASRSRELLVEHEISDVDVEIRESVVTGPLAIGVIGGNSPRLRFVFTRVDLPTML